MLRDVHVITELLAWDCPLRLVDWTPGYITSGKWDEKTKSAVIGIETKDKPAHVYIAVRAENMTAKIDDKNVTVKHVKEIGPWKQFDIKVSPGTHTITIYPLD